MGKRSRIIALVLAVVIAGTMVPFRSFAAAKKSSVKTYVFFGSDSRKNDDSWRSPGGGRITEDISGTEGVPRSDVIMLLRVDDRKKRVEAISVYRDTMLDVSGKGKDFQKANKAYSDLGPKKAVKVLEKNLDIKISGYVCTNFKGVADVVDALGGVTIKIEKDPVIKPYKTKKLKTVPDVMNSCIDEMNRIYDGNTAHIKKTGKQKLNGIQAVAYSRVRYTEGWDMKRSVRQRDVLSAMSKKYRSLSAVKKAKVLLAVSNSIETNISPAALKKLLKKTAKYKVVKKKGFPYYKKLYTFKTKKERLGESTVFVPCNLEKNVVRLHNTVYGQKKYKASKTVKKYSKKIIKKTKVNYKNRMAQFDNKY